MAELDPVAAQVGLLVDPLVEPPLQDTDDDIDLLDLGVAEVFRPRHLVADGSSDGGQVLAGDAAVLGHDPGDALGGDLCGVDVQGSS